jgi:hypothetical protein
MCSDIARTDSDAALTRSGSAPIATGCANTGGGTRLVTPTPPATGSSDTWPRPPVVAGGLPAPVGNAPVHVRDLAMTRTQKGNQWYFGMTVHVGSDTRRLVQTVRCDGGHRAARRLVARAGAHGVP